MKFPWQKKSNHFHPLVVEETADSLSFKIYSISETGPTRTSNEDSITWLFPGNNKQVLFAMIADGMGGHNAGEVASNLACSVAEHFIQSGIMRHNIPGMIQALFQQMHTSIISAANENADYSGMGTTAVLIFIQQGQIFFGHVGDSRIYRCRKGQLQQLSTDHTLVNQMIREGKLQPGDVETSQMKHLLLQALGTAEKIKPEIGESFAVLPGDYYFLCSDGIYDVLSNDEMQALLSMQKPAFSIECIRSLCYERKAQDNFSALIIEIIPYQQINGGAITREQNIIL